MTKKDIAEKIIRRFGYPVVKVELEWEHIFDAIDYARDKWLKYAVGNGTSETWITVMLSGGQNFYELPTGVTEVVSYTSDSSGLGKINTLFTIDNYLYTRGFFNGMLGRHYNNQFGTSYGWYGYDLIGYHVNLDAWETLQRYMPEKYNWLYHRYNNTLEIRPAPPSGNSLEVYDENSQVITVDSPGYALLKVFMVEGSTISSDWTATSSDELFYTSPWILDYAEAMSKVIVGRIRRKFENFTSIGNTGIALDGADLIAEGREDMEKLDEKLQLEESYIGGDIIIG